jgi:hypothetical protein
VCFPPAASAGTTALATTTAPASPSCPAQTFLQYGGVVYASEPLPPSGRPPEGETLGQGRIDAPSSAADPCKREQRDVQVVAVRGVDPGTAVLVSGETELGYILGSRCTGFSAAERWDCVRSPLRFDGVAYTGIRYPAGAQRRLSLGPALGTGTMAGSQVEVRRIEGVDSSVAVAVAGDETEAFVAPGVCPYEQFASTEARDNLRRCLKGPVWFSFAPLGGQPGDSITASGDRRAVSELAGATVALVRLREATNALPEPLGTLTPIGSISGGGGRPTLRFDIPDLPQGLYEAVVTCERCEARFGATRFPGGSIVVLAKQSGSSGAKIVYILVFAVIVVLAAAGVLMWRRGYRFGRPRSPEE